LVNDQLAERDIDPNDRRYITIKLTDSGKKVFETIESSMNQYFKMVYESIPKDKRDQVLDSLTILLEAVCKNECFR
jgi:DNA-binding MarR family transcriptional regulator